MNKSSVPDKTHAEVVDRVKRILACQGQLNLAIHPRRISLLNSLMQAQVFALCMAFSRGAKKK